MIRDVILGAFLLVRSDRDDVVVLTFDDGARLAEDPPVAPRVLGSPFLEVLPGVPRLLPAVSEGQQSNPALLAAVYDDMAEKFVQHGLNLPAVEAMLQYFTNFEGPGGCQGAECQWEGKQWEAQVGARL